MRITKWFFVCSLLLLTIGSKAQEGSNIEPPLLCGIEHPVQNNAVKPTCHPPTQSFIKDVLKKSTGRSNKIAEKNKINF